MWAGISWNGPTPIVVFEGKMDAEGYISVLEPGLKPCSKGPVKFMQDNDPKHTSRRAMVWLEEEEILCKLVESPSRIT